jgi:predicted dehydrogenase
MSVRVAVIGAGHLGQIHTRLLQSVDDARLVAVVDPSASARQAIADQWALPTFPQVSDLNLAIDAAVVAAPTALHHALGLELLERDLHLLVEKPITSSVDQADQLIRVAQDRQRVLQVGHVEQYNPAFLTALEYLGRPRYIEAVRTSGYTGRSADVGVVHDLMIHDLDLAMSLVRSRLTRVQALGISVLGGHEDMAQARLEFQNGCVVNLTASRTSFEAQRRMHVFCDDAFAAIDFANRTVKAIQPDERLLQRQLSVKQLSAGEKRDLSARLFDRWLPLTSPPVPEANPLHDELQDFVRCVQNGQNPRVGGQQARDALQAAERVLEQIHRHRWQGTESGPIGPLACPAPSVLPATARPRQRPTSDQPRRKAG